MDTRTNRHRYTQKLRDAELSKQCVKMTKSLALQNSIISYLRITKSMYRYLVIFDKLLFHFLLKKDKEDDLISSSMEFHTDRP